MMRWLVGSVSLLSTLLAGGCQFAQLTRVPVPPETKSIKPNPANDVDRAKPQPPDRLPPDLPLDEAPKKFNTVSKTGRLPIDDPPPQQLPHVQIVPPKETPPREIVQAPKHPIVLALECMLENRPQEAQYHLRNYDARSQEFLLRALPPLSLVARNSLTPTDIVAINDQLHNLTYHFNQNYSEFALPKICFCEWIKGYAVYKPLPPGHEFVASQADRPGELVQLYVGLRNFGSQANGGQFETKLSSDVEIRDDKDRVKWSHKFRRDDLTLVSDSRLGEYYHNFTFTLPPSLPPGTYTLVVHMTDETQPNTPRQANGALPFRIRD